MQSREQWGSKLGFILAASGSAVGLGNIWKFPHMAGEKWGWSVYNCIFALYSNCWTSHRNC